MERKEAIEVIKKNWPDSSFTMLREALETLIPELAESEDEKIRGAIIHFISHTPTVSKGIIGKETMLAYLEKQGKNNMGISEATKQKLEDNLNKALEKETSESWNEFLEKQGEQKSTDTCDSSTINGKEFPASEKRDFGYFSESGDKVEPKFHEGEWITNGDYTWKVVEVNPLDYILQSQDENVVDDTISHVDEQFHSFTPEDAKDGDVLVVNDNTQYQWIGIFKEHTGCTFTSYCHYNTGMDEFITNKARCRNHGTGKYSNIHPATKEQSDFLFQKIHEAGYEWDVEKKELKKAEQKTAWSEEDEKKRKGLIKGLEDRMGFGWTSNPFSREEYIDWLKSLKERVQPQPKQEWSEEDRLHYMNVLEALEYVKGCKSDYDKIEAVKSDIAWFKFLKDRYTWKPSDEQMEVLKSSTYCQNEQMSKILFKLYQDLKKLKE